MISSIIDVVLITALTVTSGCVLLMYKRLKRFDALQGDAARAFAGASEALEQARFALHGLQTEGDSMAVALANRLNEARMVINELDETLTKRDQRAAANPSPAPAPPPLSRRTPPRNMPQTQEPETLHTTPMEDTGMGKTHWTPPAAKIRAVASANRSKHNANQSTEGTPNVTWSKLAEAATIQTAH